MPVDPISDRLEAAFERVRWRFPESTAKTLYLTDDDWADLNAEASAEYGSKLHLFQYRNCDIRKGQRSRLVTDHGGLVAVPHSLSPRTRAQPRGEANAA